jgi:hypothetical protein
MVFAISTPVAVYADDYAVTGRYAVVADSAVADSADIGLVVALLFVARGATPSHCLTSTILTSAIRTNGGKFRCRAFFSIALSRASIARKAIVS